MTAREVIFAIVIAGVAGTLLLDIVSFVSHTLSNFLRQAKTKENPMDTNPDPLMTMVLDEMQSLRLIDVTPDESKKPTKSPLLRRRFLQWRIA